MTKIKVAVIYGGLSNEREVSLKSGKQVFDSLDESKYDKSLVEISKDGRWLLDGIKNLNILDPEKGIARSDLKEFDVLFLALHGKFGEDGRIQSLLDILGVPYTGSGVLASALGMDKYKSSEFVRGLDIKTPKYLYYFNQNDISLEQIDKDISSELSYPCVVKPTESGSSVGINIIKSKDDLESAIDRAFLEHDKIVIEEFIKGREITCGVMGNSFDKELLALPPVEIKSGNEFFDYDAKYFSDATEEICPAQIAEEFITQVQEHAKQIHRRFGCDGLTRSDFILRDHEFYFLEINTLPGLTEASLCPKEARAAGMSFAEFIDKQIDLAMGKKKK